MSEKMWKNYEEVAEQLLRDVGERLGLARIESKRKQTGDATDWEIDVVAFDAQASKLVLVECKRWNSSVDQATMASFAYSIRDTGAERGVFVTTIGFQEGARRIADKERVVRVILRSDSTVDNYVAELVDHIFAKITLDSLRAEPRVEILPAPKTIGVTATLSTRLNYKVSDGGHSTEGDHGVTS